jgi:hypothetical protein
LVKIFRTIYSYRPMTAWDLFPFRMLSPFFDLH